MGENNAHNTHAEKFASWLQAQGRRKTPERFAILECVQGMGRAFTLDRLYQAMAQSPVVVSRATLYNNLQLLEASGIVHRSLTRQRPQLWELAGEEHNTRLVCSRCGKVKSITDANLAAYMRAKKYTAFQIGGYELSVTGVCNACLRKKKKRQAQAKPGKLKS